MSLSQLPQLNSAMTPPHNSTSPSLAGNPYIDRKPIYLPPISSSPAAPTAAISTTPQPLESVGSYYEHIKYSN